MSPWVELAWCGLFLLLSRPPVLLGIRGAVLLAFAGVAARLYYVAYTIPTLWMLSGIPWVVVMAFYVMTALWVVYLVRLWRGRPVHKFAAVMARLAFLESAVSLNSAAGLVMSVLLGGRLGSVFGPAMGLVFAVAQMVYFFQQARDNR
ncbi:MAG: hypothetical protein RL328_1199 [Acidobacteriota bacterium]